MWALTELRKPEGGAKAGGGEVRVSLGQEVAGVLQAKGMWAAELWTQ